MSVKLARAEYMSGPCLVNVGYGKAEKTKAFKRKKFKPQKVAKCRQMTQCGKLAEA